MSTLPCPTDIDTGTFSVSSDIGNLSDGFIIYFSINQAEFITVLPWTCWQPFLSLSFKYKRTGDKENVFSN